MKTNSKNNLNFSTYTEDYIEILLIKDPSWYMNRQGKIVKD